MKSKNILILAGVIGVGLILYKLLLGFILPIALFVSLRYVLKFLLKGSETDSPEEVAQILASNMKSSSKENVVEIKPVEESKPNGEVKPVEEPKPNGEVNIS